MKLPMKLSLGITAVGIIAFEGAGAGGMGPCGPATTTGAYALIFGIVAVPVGVLGIIICALIALFKRNRAPDLDLPNSISE
jgi:hypothetical protein